MAIDIDNYYHSGHDFAISYIMLVPIPLFRLTVLGAMPCLLSLNTLAAASEDIEHISVTAAGYQQLVSQAPASISVIDHEQLAYRAYRDVTDVLRDIAGVTVSGGGSRQDISIRGMPAQYTALLVDGKKQSGRESQPNSSGGFEQDWLPPVDAIERIEVVRGPMSTLYGSDAIGGVINIITRKDSREWAGNLRLEAVLQQNEDAGNEYRTQLYAAGPLLTNTLNASVSMLSQRRIEDNIERGYADKTLSNINAALHYTLSPTDILSAQATLQEQQRSTTAGRSQPATAGNSFTDNDRKTYSLTHEGTYDTLTGRSFVQVEEVNNQGRQLQITNTLANTQWNFMALEHHTITLGAEYSYEDLSENIATQGVSLTNRQVSLYGSNEWHTTDDISLTFGLRLDNNEQFDEHYSPRVYAVYTLDDNWTIKGGIATGYRAPDLRDMAAGWVQESRGGDIYGNPELQPETTISQDIAVYYAPNNTFNTSLSLFNNDFSDKISVATCPLQYCAQPDARYNINIDEARSRGIEFSLSQQIGAVYIDTAYTYTSSQQKTGDNAGLPLTQLPRHKLTVNTRWQAHEALELWSRTTFRGAETELASVGSRSILAPSRTLIDIGMNWRYNSHLELLSGIYNVLDKTLRYDDYGYVEDGRRLWLSAKMRF